MVCNAVLMFLLQQCFCDGCPAPMLPQMMANANFQPYPFLSQHHHVTFRTLCFGGKP